MTMKGIGKAADACEDHNMAKIPAVRHAEGGIIAVK